MATILVCHGAWSGGWAWRKMHGPLRALGHELVTPTYTGLGERSHLAGPTIDLETHIEDILQVIHYEDLDGFILLGHSYGGMVATGVADRAAGAVAHVAYLDAFVPEDGESVFDLRAESAEALRQQIATEGDGWFIPPGPLSADMSEADRAWVGARRGRQPARTFEQRLKVEGNAADKPKSYIYCRNKIGRDDPFKAVGERVRALPGWRYFEMDAGHTPNFSAPEELARIIDDIATGQG